MIAMRIEFLSVICERGEGEKLSELIEGVTKMPSLVRANGTASSEIIGALGLGEPEKDLLISFCAYDKLDELYKIFDGYYESGSSKKIIAFTVPLSSVAGDLTLKAIFGENAEETK